MKHLKTYNQLNEDVDPMDELDFYGDKEEWFGDILDRVVKFKTWMFPNSIYYKLDDEIIMEYDELSELLYVIDKKWSVFEKIYHMKCSEIEAFIKSKVEDYFNIGPLSPSEVDVVYTDRWWKNIPLVD